MQTVTLVSSGDLDEFHRDGVRRALDTINRLDAAGSADPQAAVDSAWKPVASLVPVLDRANAEFTDDGRSAPKVKLTVPYAGLDNVLYMRADGFDEDDDYPYATITYRGSFKEREPLLVIERTFDAGVTAEVVREWAKEQVDLVETHLRLLRKQAEKLDTQARPGLIAAVTRRAEAVTSNKTLREQLGRGI